MLLVKHIAFICILLSSHHIEANFNGTIMFDLDEAVDQRFLRAAYNLLADETGFSLTPGRKFDFVELPHLPLLSTADVLQKEIGKMENASTMMLIGRKTYMGMKFAISKIKTKVANYPMNYLPVFDFPMNLSAKIVAKVYKHLRKADNQIPVRTMFILNSTEDNPQRPWEDFQILSILLRDIGSNLRLAYYKDNALEIVRTIRDNAVTDIVVMVNAKATEAILEAAHDRSLLNWRYRWLIYLQSTSTLDIESVGYNKNSENITVIQFADAEGDSKLPMRNSLSVLSYDAINLAISVLQVVLNDTLKGTATVIGKTGNFSLDYSKLNATVPDAVCRRDFWIMHVYHGLGKEVTLVGNITGFPDDDSFTLSMLPEPKINPISDATVLKELRSNPFRIITVVEKPFVQYKANISGTGTTDLKNKLEGFVIDITKALMESINISYVIKLEPSGKYGAKQPNGSWNGMMLQIMNQKADFAAGAFWINEERSKMVDFLNSFMGFRGAILLKENNDTGVTAIFSFLSPFHYNVWCMLAGVMVVIAFVLTIINCIFPNKTNYTFFESSYYVIGSMFQGVATSPPDRSSSRIIICFWWFFTLIIIIAYVSNYTASRTQTRLQGSIRTLEDLLSQGQYSYGTVKDTGYDTMFAKSTFEHVQKINKMMRHEFDNGLVDNGSAAMELVREGKYAFIWDSTITRYYAYEECLRSTAEFDNYQYGFIIPKNADFKDLFNKHLGILKKNGKLAAILKRYPYLTGAIQNPKCEYVGFTGLVRKFMPDIPFKHASEHAVNFEHFLGIFMIIVGGCILSLIAALIECSVNFCCRRRARRRAERLERVYMHQANLKSQSKA